PRPGRAELTGTDAVAELVADGSMARVAATANVSSADLASLFVADDTMILTAEQLIGFVEPPMSLVNPSTRAEQADSTRNDTPVAAATPPDVFSLHSNPG